MTEGQPTSRSESAAANATSANSSDEGRCCYRNESHIWQPRCVVWMLSGFSALLLYTGLVEGQVIGADMGAGPVSAELFWFCIASSAVCFTAMMCYCRVTPLTVHIRGNRMSITFLRLLGSKAIRFDGDDLKAVSELSVSSEYGYTPTMYRVVLRSRWLPILLDERADVLHLAPIKALLR